MALGERSDLSLAFFWTLFFVQILQYESLTLWPVDSCPGNQSEVEAATLRLNCSDARKSINVYHCLPLSNLSDLVEFCYDGRSGLVEAGNCMVLYRETLNNYQCGHFKNGCPNAYYFPKNMYKYPACLKINTQNNCYIADPSCPNIRFFGTTTISSVTSTDKSTNMLTYTAVDNKSLYVEATSIPAFSGNNNHRLLHLIPILLGVFLPLLAIVLVILLNCRRDKRTDPTEEHEQKENLLIINTVNEDTSFEMDETSPLITDTPMNEDKHLELEESLPLKSDEDDSLNEIQTYLEDDEFLERYQKYLEEGSVEVCPISQIIIVGEHGVGKTTLLYRLQGRRLEEIKAIKSTRGIEHHTEQHSFIITKNQLRMNVKGISSLSADPRLISEFTGDKRNNGKETLEKSLQGNHGQSELNNTERKTNETADNIEERDLEDTREERIPENGGEILTEKKEEIGPERQAEVFSRPDHDSQSEHAIEFENDEPSEHAKELDYEIQSDDFIQTEYDIQSDQKIQVLQGAQADHDAEVDNNKQTEHDKQSLLPMLRAKLEERQKLISKFGNKDDVVLDVLDFAGQGEYYASHQTYIRKNAIFILVIDTSKDIHKRSENNIKEWHTRSPTTTYKDQYLCDRPGVAFNSWSPKDYFCYWLNTVRMHGGNSENIIFVGTHKDEKRDDFDFELLLDNIISEKLMPAKYVKPVVTELSRFDEEIENDIHDIKNSICKLIDNREKEHRPAKWVKFSNIFEIVKRKFQIVKIEKVLEMTDHFDFEMSDMEVADMLHFFHSSGKIIFFNIDKLQEIIILDIQWFTDCFKYIISDRKHVDEDCVIVDGKDKEMLLYFRDKGVLDTRLYEKLLKQRDIPQQFWNILGEYQSKLGMMFNLKNYKNDDDVTIQEGWYVPSINTQEFKPNINEYKSEESSQILCFRFKDYLPHDIFGRLIVTCLNSGHWNPYDFRLCKAGADMCYQDSDMAEGEQVYLFTSKRIITAQFVGKHSGNHGHSVRQEIESILRHFCQFYASSTGYDVGFLCCKEEGYKDNSVDHFVPTGNRYCQGCTKRFLDQRRETEFGTAERNYERPNSIRREMDTLQNSCEVYFHVVKRCTEIADNERTLKDVKLEKNTQWLDMLVDIERKLKDLYKTAAEGREIDLLNINRKLKNVSLDFCKDLRKDIFFLSTQSMDNLKRKKGIPLISLGCADEIVHGNNIKLKAENDVAILHHLWFRKTLLDNKYRVLHPNDEKEKFDFQDMNNSCVLTIKDFNGNDEGYYYVVVETENGYSICRETVVPFAVGIPVQLIMKEDKSVKRILENLKKGTTLMYHASGMIVGCAGSGKTTLLERLKDLDLAEIKKKITSTRGVDVYTNVFDVTHTIKVNESNQNQRFTVKNDETLHQKMDLEYPVNRIDDINTDMPQDQAEFETKKKYKEEISLENVDVKTNPLGRNEAFVLSNNTEETRENVADSLEITGFLRVSAASDVPEKKITIVDFAGQCSYYASHEIFLSPRAFFLLVLNMEKKFDDQVGEEVCSQEGSIFKGMTHRDYLRFWVKNIHQYSSEKAPVILIGTHAEGKTEKEKTLFFRETLKTLKTKNGSLQKHFKRERMFAVGFDDNENIEKIKHSIIDVVQELDHWGEYLPNSWTLFETFFREKKDLKMIKKHKLLVFNDALPQGIKLETVEDMNIMLQFFHDTKIVLYFAQELLNEVIILDVQWFADAFKNIITDKNHTREDLFDLASEWDIFYEVGELNDTLLSAIWRMNNNGYIEHKNDIMLYMEKLGLLAKMSDKKWYVPCMNKMPFPSVIFSSYPASSILCYVFDVLPAGIFQRLVATCMQIPWMIVKNRDRLCIYQTAAVFMFQDHCILIGVTFTDIQLQVFVLEGEVDKSTCLQIKDKIDNILNILTETFQTASKFDLAFKCKATGFCDYKESSVINKSKFTQRSFLCPSCPIERKHIINSKNVMNYWIQVRENEAEASEDKGSYKVPSSRSSGPFESHSKGNFAKILKLIQVGTDAVRICFDKFFPKEDLEKTLKDNETDIRRGQFRFQQPQLEIIFPPQGGSNTSVSSLSMDITIMYKLLRNFSDIAPPGNGWGREPKIVDITESDDIERIRLYRNRYSHDLGSSPVMSDDVFRIIWADLSQAILRLSGGVLKRRISEI